MGEEGRTRQFFFTWGSKKVWRAQGEFLLSYLSCRTLPHLPNSSPVLLFVKLYLYKYSVLVPSGSRSALQRKQEIRKFSLIKLGLTAPSNGAAGISQGKNDNFVTLYPPNIISYLNIEHISFLNFSRAF